MIAQQPATDLLDATCPAPLVERNDIAISRFPGITIIGRAGNCRGRRCDATNGFRRFDPRNADAGDSPRVNVVGIPSRLASRWHNARRFFRRRAPHGPAAVDRFRTGYNADIVALDGDPLTDISAVTRVAFVMKGGKVSRPPQLPYLGRRSYHIEEVMPEAIPARPADTGLDAERVQVALLRAAPVARRLHLALALSATVIGAARRALARAQPGASARELDLWFVELHYGADLAASVRADLDDRDIASRLGA